MCIPRQGFLGVIAGLMAMPYSWLEAKLGPGATNGHFWTDASEALADVNLQPGEIRTLTVHDGALWAVTRRGHVYAFGPETRRWRPLDD